MKVGDLVSLREHRFVPQEEKIYYRHGVIIMIKDFGRSGIWYEVQWNKESLWHRPDELEMISED